MDINYLNVEQFPKTHEVWGDEGFKRINELLDKAVHLVNRKVKRDILYAGLSENKSIVDTRPVVFIDCEGGNRYHISERNIKNGELPKPDRWQKPFK